MKKTVTKSYETVVCDICGNEEDPARGREIKKCPVCHKDTCPFCEVIIHFSVKKNGHATVFEKCFCKEHVAGLLLELIKEKVA